MKKILKFVDDMSDIRTQFDHFQILNIETNKQLIKQKKNMKKFDLKKLF